MNKIFQTLLVLLSDTFEDWNKFNYFKNNSYITLHSTIGFKISQFSKEKFLQSSLLVNIVAGGIVENWTNLF